MVLSQRRKSEELNTFELGSLTLTPRGLEILELLGAGNPPCKVADAVGVSRSAVTYWIRKLKEHGFIKLQIRDVYKIFALTYLGEQAIKQSSRGVRKARRTVVLEDYPIKFRLVQPEKTRVSWEKLGNPRNWVKLGFKIGGIRVVKTSKSIIVHPGRLKGWDPYRLVYVAGRECGRAASWLQRHLGMVLGPGEPIKRPTFQVYDPLAEEVTKYYSFNSDAGGADRSPPSRRGHWEMGPEVARDYLLSLSRLREVQNRLDRVDEQLDGVNYTLNRLIEQIEDLVGELHSLVVSLKGAAPQPTKRPELSTQERFVV